VWTGGDDQTVRFRSTALGQGANMALPVWGKFMQKVYQDTTLDISQEDFPLPSDSSINLNFDCSGYQVPEMAADSAFVPEELPDNRLDFYNVFRSQKGCSEITPEARRFSVR